MRLTNPWPALRTAWRRWRHVPFGILTMVGECNLGLIAGGVAFFAMLALFPGLAAVIAIWGLLANTAAIERQLSLLDGFVPERVYDLLRAQFEALAATDNSALGWATILSTAIALWSARAGVGAMIGAVNTLHGHRKREGLNHIATAMVMTLVLVGVALVALATVVLVPVILTFLPVGAFTGGALQVVRWLIALAVVVLGLGLIYRYGPHRHGDRAKLVTPGSVLAVAIWGVASFGLSYYLANFGGYNRIYGSIGAVVGLLIWLYISAFAALLGAALNAQIDRGDVSASGTPPAPEPAGAPLSRTDATDG